MGTLSDSTSSCTTDMSDARAVAIVAALVLAPFALVALAAIMRGYTIDVHMTRDERRRARRRHADDSDDGA